MAEFKDSAGNVILGDRQATHGTFVPVVPPSGGPPIPSVMQGSIAVPIKSS